MQIYRELITQTSEIGMSLLLPEAQEQLRKQEQTALELLDSLQYVKVNRLFRFEREYDREMITDGERTRRRQGLPTMEAMINLRANLLQELKSEEEQKSCYMREALNYLHKFWNEAFTYIKDGRYPISNNLAERAVRPFTTKRKNSLHFGSDEGAEIAAVYHSIISTVKLQGRSAWDYLGKFFTGIFNGCRDFLSLTPQNIDLAVCQ